MVDLESKLRAYATRLDERYPDVTLDELTTPPDVRVRPQTSREHHGRALILIAAAVVLMIVGALVLVVRDDAGGPQVPVAPPAVPTAASGLIAFAGSSGESRAESDAEIYVVAPDGTGLRALTSTPGVSEMAPAWSPDGTRLAFLRNARSGGGELVVIDPATGNETFSADIPNRPNTDVLPPEWSPDGRLILFNVANCGCALIVDLDTRTWITSDGQSWGWSPDGKWFLWKLEPSFDRSQLLLVPADLLGTTDLDDITNLPGVRPLVELHWPSGVTWMPDSSAVAIDLPDNSIEVVTIADGQRRTLIKGTMIEDGRTTPSWSPDGSHIAYLRSVQVPDEIGRVPADLASVDPRQEGGSVWVAAADGTGARVVASSLAAPIWSPGGSLLTVVGDDGLFTVRPDGTGMTRLTRVTMPEKEGPFSPGTGVFFRPVWQPGATEAANTDATDAPLTTEAAATTAPPATTDG